jgi:glycosyltransferase involved in cell wall biosynthesis
MLGWEFPPYIAGGLGTACEGLTTALLKAKELSIHFIATGGNYSEPAVKRFKQPEHLKLTVTRINSQLSPYRTSLDVANPQTPLESGGSSSVNTIQGSEILNAPIYPQDMAPLFKEVARFTEEILSLVSESDFDLIHAHDWMTFPAAIALQSITRRPFIAHVHSLEFDRSGVFSDPKIEEIESKGLGAADRIIAVSYYTKREIERLYEVKSNKISVVHNGVYPRLLVSDYREKRSWPKNVVLFLGRVTAQKGPEHFVRLAARVVPAIDDILFVLAGDGDLLPAMRDLVKSLGIERNFLFTGFVHGEELEELFSVASIYVMPSVSEPFGIAALEALSFDTPVIVSTNAGVSEVAASVVQVDLADLDQMACTVIELLNNKALRCEIVAQAREEVAALHWGVAADKVIDVYGEIIARSDR